MSVLGVIQSALYRPFIGLRSFSSLTCRVVSAAPTPLTSPGLLDACARLWPAAGQLRTAMRVHFPRPREVKRLRTHGWKTRLQTPAGRRIIMRRLLKGRHVLSH
ncbi:39S ribosomal protein L34, mitochondrial-like [Amphibalanus amphitrite]|uniref:39S ribosomal protein L34, mitochondrial-like n=1 Tax=Amphibalanus amphitrite TaxID=1232801 RepID=UPI001C919C2E|nr:39S ribosomal protein L34, mitochondrial-like [Amphibalanus amphitrite]XP_043223068.1 39S ribosomal protein L34, mitochondrial-like [Amphibalanus amphitrite]XP_043223069.1 39S ribosomal protein L34, mitochondrial-like [Amphibalanus amphitrite]XP_043223070.1 39S ribosomal protein L34, mitochondrial-like [Amphibalanus amphitrite]XP_043223071.1 39S ribosomal protein L34, mitochondrial-like [Amphibalanus amphitrite]XP_043223072.1 39S ribosomal protein L34, mitochondrial-like [Amphibalanus amphi